MSFLVEQLERTLQEVERLEKENARLAADKERLEIRLQELEAQVQPGELPGNMVDAGRFFLKKLDTGGLDDIPYCGVCKSPMKAHSASDDPIEFRCAGEACNFALPYRDLMTAYQKYGVKPSAPDGS
ncbi:MAG: bZIP transcription factor [Candidatus Adiutrix sp.]|jgi:hypothetical protein|nr:bZIP transcription factor [Candidatus Adiutrix sp.]